MVTHAIIMQTDKIFQWEAKTRQIRAKLNVLSPQQISCGLFMFFAVLAVIKSDADLPVALVLIIITHKDATQTSEKGN